MGKKEKVRKVVLDTNVLVSALLFKGEMSKIVDLWRKKKIIPVISKETFKEFKTVLAYPKFSLTEEETVAIIEENILPFFEVVEITSNINGICRDPNDDKFLSCAVSAGADYIVSGDKDLWDLGRYKSVRIISVADLLRRVS